MISIENYDVQAVRREADQQRDEAQRRLSIAIKTLLDKGSTVMEITEKMGMTEDEIIALLPELSPA